MRRLISATGLALEGAPSTRPRLKFIAWAGGGVALILRALQHSARERDLVARLGGDEFVVMLGDIDRAASGHAAHRLAATANAALQGSSSLTASVGAAHFAHSVVPVEEMLRAADSLMHRAKQAGRGSLIVEAFPAHGRAAA